MLVDKKLRQTLLEILIAWEMELLEKNDTPCELITSKVENNDGKMPTKVILSVKELSVYLGISQDCLYAMVRENQIPFIRVRRRILFYKESIDAWLKKQQP
ncbi:helix-turn-helix domain-containing protein [Paenibacillus aestuarii]|uniref:Helix-turn-helix domain-containing protein n=1 Tax=Paenibacillus aestuarii TaxID=516965 RepID=A0ABW0KHF2_9BACL